MSHSLARPDAYQLVLTTIGAGNLLKHILAVEAGMRRVASHLGEDVERWGLTGLLHDLDYHQTKDSPERHTYVTREMLQPYNLPEDLLYAINAHPGHVPCRTRLDWGLYAIDPSTGFIVACALMHPEKKLSVIDTEFMLRRFREKRFAAGATRENITACRELGLELEPFLDLVLDGMRQIAPDLGLA